jgi:hypothetical protein
VVTRQREFQIKLREKGLCIKCGKEAEDAVRKTKHGSKGPYCTEHKEYDRQRKEKAKRLTDEYFGRATPTTQATPERD